jgi:hypothetical protein
MPDAARAGKSLPPTAVALPSDAAAARPPTVSGQLNARQHGPSVGNPGQLTPL